MTFLERKQRMQMVAWKDLLLMAFYGSHVQLVTFVIHHWNGTKVNYFYIQEP